MLRVTKSDLRRGPAAKWALIALVLSACAGSPPAEIALDPMPAPADVRFTLFLVGDAGDPDPDGEPVLMALENAIHATPNECAVVFLGDNVYPRGLLAQDDPDSALMASRLQAQIDAVANTPAQSVFIPGNHDWDKHAEGGWDAIRRQQSYIDEHGGGNVTLLPRDGCPGPVVRDFGDALRLVVLDTQWWFHGGPKPGAATVECRFASTEGIITALIEALETADGRPVVVVGHHPLISSGPHGGYFGWQDHIFPLRKLAGWAWLPLPVIGSVYPLVRMSGTNSQDQAHGTYKQFRTSLEAVFEQHPPLAYASGHEHVMEVLAHAAAGLQIVAGAGIYGHTEPAKWRKEHHFRASEAGLARIDLMTDGSARIAVLLVDETGRAREPYAELMPPRR